jgi:hypothetical protein
MIDQVRVTVIATGFDETRLKLERMVSRPVTKLPEGLISTISQPKTEVGKEEKEEEGEIKKVEVVPEEFESELDIPAFLRQGK